MFAMLIEVIAILLFAGLALWVLAQFPELNAMIAKLIRIAVIVFVSIFLIYLLFGLAGGTGFAPFPRTR